LAIPLFSVFVVSRLGLGEYPSDAMDTDPQSDVRGYQGTTDISRHQTTTSPAPVLRPHISEQQHQANIFALEQEHGREKVQMQQDHTLCHRDLLGLLLAAQGGALNDAFPKW
jgi:hypothetical protein